jgi:hypothetical protein
MLASILSMPPIPVIVILPFPVNQNWQNQTIEQVKWAIWWIARWAIKLWDLPWIRVLAMAGVYFWFWLALDDHLRFSRGSTLLGLIGTWVVLVAWMPCLIWSRRHLAPKEFAESKGWNRAVTILLWVSITFAVLMITGACTFLYLTGPLERPYSWGTSLGVEILVSYGVVIGGGIGLLGFLIQLWRNRWRRPLMSVCACLYAIPLLFWAVATGG